jgi:hypothetical protein
MRPVIEISRRNSFFTAMCSRRTHNARLITLIPYSGVVISHNAGGEKHAAWARRSDGELAMATRERRLAEFDGAGSPPPGTPVQVLCEDKSGTYQLPFTCCFADGQWRNHDSGGTVEATVVAWRLPRLHSAK